MDLISKEKRLALKLHLSDGIIELVIGAVLSAWGILSLHGSYLVSIVWLPLFFIKPLKSLVTFPRVGYHVLSPESKRIVNSFVMIILAIVLGLGLVVMANQAVALFVKEYGLFLLMVAILCSGMTVFVITRLYRFLGYTVVSFLSVGIVYLSKWGANYALIITGGVLLISGLVVMGMFIAKNSITSNEE